MNSFCLASNEAAKAVRSFWLLGLLNNAPWVLMLAVATNISAGGVALVFISNQIPGLIVKITAPYWFHLISYKTRILMASVAMGLACFLVGCGGLVRDEMAGDGNAANEPNNAGGKSWGLALELLGVSFVSFSCSLGEATILALAGKFDSVVLPAISGSNSYLVISEESTEGDTNSTSQQIDDENIFREEYELDSSGGENGSESNAVKLMKQESTHGRACITAFSSGTGIAGIVGYGYKSVCSDLFGLGLSATVWSAMVFALVYFQIYRRGLHRIEQRVQQDASAQSEVGTTVASESSLLVESDHGVSERNSTGANLHNKNRMGSSSALEMVSTENMQPSALDMATRTDSTVSSDNLTTVERFKLVLSFWPYTIPLFTVYAAEYMLQAGVWSAMGFPVESASARAQFYHNSNWTYQAGVFISRSSGNLCIASLPVLWLMPFLQVVNLYFFWWNAIHHWWYNYGLLLPCFFAGLLGGGVYVQGFSRVNMDMPVGLKEFAIASVGVADSLGILVADVVSLFIQSCIYSHWNLEGAVVECPVNMM